jgi:hypothetical protein
MAPTLQPDIALDLALAVVASSQTPLLLLDRSLKITGASTSVCRTFHLEPAEVRGRVMFKLGAGE